jgi:endonuclease III
MQQHPLFRSLSSIAEINRRLRRSHEPLLPRVRSDPVSQLVRSLIGARTLDAASDRAFSELRKHLYPWEAILRAPDDVLLRCLEPVRFADKKARHLRGAMRMIQGWVGALCLDFLDDRSVEDAQVWLRELPGVDMKVSAAVLNFSTLRKRVLVVDTHHFRVAKRLGLLKPNTPFASAQRVLMNQHAPNEWSADDLDDHHSLMKLHGQNYCLDERPLCGLCPLQDICATGRPLISSTPTLRNVRPSGSARGAAS